MDYEKKLEELESILEDMESSDIKLNDLMSKYKKALNLYEELESYLDSYKEEIKKMSSDGLVDFDESEIDEDEEPKQ